jgi:hypothetical protein
MFPFKEKSISENLVLREFTKSDVTDEQMWHRDAENRTVIVLESGGWSFQKDNDLPTQLTNHQEIFIPKETWHRVIQGEGVLKVKVIKETLEESEFSYMIAQAAVDGKKEVKIGDKSYPVKMSKETAKRILDEKDEGMHEADKPHPKGYKAKEGTKRDKQLDDAKAAYKAGNFEKAKNIRDKMEKEAREKPSYRSRKSKYTEEILMDEALADLLQEVFSLKEAKKMSEKTRTALKNKAKKHNAPLGALTAVYRKGLGAFYSSGSRPGMGPHQWAMARVNSFLKGGKARQVDASQWNQVKKHRKKK